MGYTVQTWTDGVSAASAARLTHMEDGIFAAIPKDLVDAKGDILAATAADTVARLAVGSNGQVLTAASGQATGLQWTTPAAPVSAPVVLFDSTLGSAAASIDSGSGGFATTYAKIVLELYAAGSTAAGEVTVTMTFNNDTGANYDYVGDYIFNSTAVAVHSSANAAAAIGGVSMPGSTAPASSFSSTVWEVLNYGGTVGHKSAQGRTAIVRGTGATDQLAMLHAARWRSTAAITRVIVTAASGNFIIGTRFRVVGHP